MTTPADVIRQASRWVGFVEGPRNNETPFGKWYGMDLQPYCAMALSMWSFDAGLPIPASTSKGYAYTPSGANWFRARGRWGTTPRVGAHVFFRFSGDRIHHVGLVTGVNGDGTIDTIEANTSSGSAGSQRDGGGVWRRRRGRAGIVGYGYPDYSAGGAPAPTPTPPEEDPVLIPIDVQPGKEQVIWLEPTSDKGAGFLRTKAGLIVVTTHRPTHKVQIAAPAVGLGWDDVTITNQRPFVHKLANTPAARLVVRNNDPEHAIGGSVMFDR